MGDGYPAKRARTRAALVRSGLELVGEHGPTALTASGVATGAGVSHGTFYNHFDGLDDLRDALREELAGVFEFGTEQLRHLSGDPAARVALGTQQLLALPGTDPVFGRAFVRLLATDRAFRSRIRAVVADEVRRGAERGIFRVDSVDASTDALLGAGVQNLRAALAEETSATVEQMAAATLRQLGVEDLAGTPEGGA